MEFYRPGANEQAMAAEVERFGLEATPANPAGIVVSWIDGKIQVADDQEYCCFTGEALVSAVKALRELSNEEGPEFFWQTIAKFADPAED